MRNSIKKIGLLFFIALVLGSCKSLPPTVGELKVFKAWDELYYPYQKIVNEDASTTLQDVLVDQEISMLADWRKSEPVLKNLFQTECAGCSNTVGGLQPLYRVEKGKYIHFGLKNSMGVENLVFQKNGHFINRFYMFQGQSKNQVHEELKDIRKIDQALEGIYPTQMNSKRIHLEHITYDNLDLGVQWYKTMYPTKMGYMIDFKKKSPDLQFKFEGGLYSYQENNKRGDFKIVNFYEPSFLANAVGHGENLSFIAHADGYYANATFFLISLDEEAEITIEIQPYIKGTKFLFSVFENSTFHTMDKYLNKKEKLFSIYTNRLKKDDYLIRVIHHSADYSEVPLYSMKITKVPYKMTNKDQ
ncbi:MAG: hypothetical protein R2814_11440 [Flavobacteriaceae bacterium]